VLLFLFRRCSQPDPKDEDLTLEQRDQREVEVTARCTVVSREASIHAPHYETVLWADSDDNPPDR
jgi:hypothetical protein